MASGNSQKFIARNRAPRVQIEYDVELYGSEKKVELPFVMGVMSDLSGKSENKSKKMTDRKFVQLDQDNFDSTMEAIKPRVEFSVPNTLTGDGNLKVDMEFESMEDFTPGRVAQKVDALNKLMTARKELSNLMSYMDGKSDAEDLVSNILSNPELMKSLTSVPKQETESAKNIEEKGE